MDLEDTRKIARKYALKNAIDYGKAKESVVVNKLLSIDPGLKSEIKALYKVAMGVCTEVNALSRGELEAEYSQYSEEFKSLDLEKAEKSSRPNFNIDGAELTKMVTRFAPEPSGYMHLGHAKPVILSNELKKLYEGKIYLYFDDTNPEKEKQEYVDSFKKDLSWLGITFDKEYYASDNIERMYGYSFNLIDSGNAYICECSAEEIKKNRFDGKACSHRERRTDENRALFQKMINGGYGEGEVLLRLKGEMKANNTSMRDPSLVRVKKSSHYRQGQKYSAWPNYDLNTPIMDSINGVTDIIRSKEYELRDELYYRILDLLSLRKPRIHEIGRFKIANNLTSKRKINALIKDGEVSGYDDLRLVTMMALKRRGILPDAITSLMLKFGISKTESITKLDSLLAENRKFIEPNAKRLFMVRDPVKLRVNGLNGKEEVSLKLHPHSDLGSRTYVLSNDFLISSADASALKARSRVRLKDAITIEVKEKSNNGILAAIVTGDAAQKIHWVNSGNYIKCKILLIGDLLNGEEFDPESMRVYEGYAESYVSNLEEGESIQFEREGFFNLENKKDLSFVSI
jgi:glutamyl-tRNA synthetase